MASCQKRKILLYNKDWNTDKELNHDIIDGFELTTEHKYMDQAAAVIFHMPTLPQRDSIWTAVRKKEGQLWVFWSMECEAHYKWQYQPEIAGLFDIMATYKLDSDLPVPYFYSGYHNLLRNKPVPKTEFLNAFISSSFDQSGRLKYLKELMSCISVHSYGRALNNKQLDSDEGITTKGKIIASYKFSVAFENAIAKDYVTEKFFEPLIAGSVPIYLGAPNIDDFTPGDKCYINAHSFPSVKALADYLLELENNDEAYIEYLKWKTLPFKKKFSQKLSMVEKDPLIRLCDILKKRL